MKVKSATFLKSVANADDLPKDMPEVCFVGRSNVGKSSLLNALVNQKKLAKTSSTAGLTKLLNYFVINNEFYFVDLPGYGFHSASKQKEQLWVDLINDYFEKSKNLKLVCVLLDIRIEPTKNDEQMLAYLNFNKIPYIIITTKADKLSKSQSNVRKSKIASSLKLGLDNIFVTSSQTKEGIDSVLAKINQFVK